MMHLSKTIPLCCYPTTTVVVDDNAEFLKAIKLNLRKKTSTNIFSDPHAVIDYFAADSQPSFDFYADNQEEEDADHLVLDIDLSKIHELAFNPDRFTETTVLIVDYDMPAMTGIELVKSIDKNYLYTILLTGKASTDDVIDAFNQKIISQYMPKNLENLSGEILQSIGEGNVSYFTKQTAALLKGFETKYAELVDILKDKDLISFFNEKIQALDIVEFYLLNYDGDFLLIDANGKKHILLVKSETAMYSYQNMVELSDEDNIDHIIEALARREQAPFIYIGEYAIPTTQWSNKLYPVQKISDTTGGLYVGCFELGPQSYFDANPIRSLKDFLQQSAMNG